MGGRGGADELPFGFGVEAVDPIAFPFPYWPCPGAENTLPFWEETDEGYPES
jgi:hypothetical protein